MFGLFTRNKQERQELAQLERDGAPNASDAFTRRRHVSLVHLIHGDLAALPFYDSIVRDFPGNQRMAFIAATIRLDRKDPAGIRQIRAVAEARPSLAVPAYGTLSHYFHDVGDEEEWQRVQSLFVNAVEREGEAREGGLFEDPGGPLEAPRYSAGEIDHIRERLLDTRSLVRLLGGSRILDDGSRQQVLLAEMQGRDWNSIMARVATIADLFGDFVLYPLDTEHRWLEQQMLQFMDACFIHP